MILAQPWGFKPGEITFEKIFLWHGERDRFIPAAPARLLARELPRCTAVFYPEEGHFSVLICRSQEILDALRR